MFKDGRRGPCFVAEGMHLSHHFPRYVGSIYARCPDAVRFQDATDDPRMFVVFVIFILFFSFKIAVEMAQSDMPRVATQRLQTVTRRYMMY